MANLNKVFLIGNLTRAPELRYTAGGAPVTKMGLATNRSWKDASGAQKEEVTFVDITVFGKSAEACSRYLAKGSPCFIEGRLNYGSWEDKTTGQKRSKLDVVAERVQFLSRKGEGPAAETPGEQTAGEEAAPAGAGSSDAFADDVPF